nr:MAG TPA: hypothetical protein [Crassvirales sp.]
MTKLLSIFFFNFFFFCLRLYSTNNKELPHHYRV